MSKDLYLKYKYIWEQQNNTLDSLYTYIKNYNIDMDDYGNITVTNTDKKEVPAFCCHLDTVHGKAPAPRLIKDDILISFNGGGIGGDDKCGIVACLELLENVECKCIFFREEERGALGSREYDAETLKDNLYQIEIDRCNAGDLIFKACGTALCDKQFKKEVKKYFPHGQDETGALTDVVVLGKAGINMMNLSSGYYNPHTPEEYVVLSELQLNINCLIAMAKEYKEKRNYERTKATISTGLDGYADKSLFGAEGYGGYGYPRTWAEREKEYWDEKETEEWLQSNGWKKD